MEKSDDKIKLINEINLIEDEGIRNLTASVIKLAPKYFWEIPASITGKNHPPDENCIHGKLLHTKRVVSLANQLCVMENIKGMKTKVSGLYS